MSNRFKLLSIKALDKLIIPVFLSQTVQKMVKFQAFYPIFLLTVVVSVMSGRSKRQDLPADFCGLNRATMVYSPSEACLEHCDYFEHKGAACDKYKCFCVPYDDTTTRQPDGNIDKFKI